MAKKSKKKKGPDVQMSTVKFVDVGWNDVTLVVGIRSHQPCTKCATDNE